MKKLVVLAALALALMGCATQPELPAFQPAKSQSALIRWQRRDVSLTSEGVFAQASNGGVLMRLYKQSPAPLLELRLEPNGLLSAKGSLAGPGWSGQVGNAPPPLAIWAALLNIYQTAATLPDGTKEIQTAEARLSYVKNQSGFASLSIVSTDRPETVTVLFR